MRADISASMLVEKICDECGMSISHKRRVMDAFNGAPRKRIRFSEARDRLGIKDAREWHTRCKRDVLLATVEVMQETRTSAYCWEDEINRVAAKMNKNGAL